ncbi:hypothetical protein [Nodosilinea sp. FACHB-13]|uniref:hypothetical protein n=1 Tax=Cyanophyceae TaxID=3028117 RepID=UPI0016869D24|nr:hypothetical protein [Nodosilinea sp. FACHB-13]MBD2106704.1 hypothetical protein [Nodosilinea sp. FACHB-13]
MANTSLHKFCKDNGIPKTSAYERCKLLDIPTRDGLSPEDQRVLLREFGKAVVVEPETTPEPAAPAGGITIDVGNHRGELSLPQPPSTIDLGTYRGDNAALTSFEPEDIDRFLAACDGFVEAVDADFQHQQAVTQQKEAAAIKVRSRVEQVKQASLLYQVRSETLALHNRSLDAELQAGLSTLGKPSAAPAAG